MAGRYEHSAIARVWNAGRLRVRAGHPFSRGASPVIALVQPHWKMGGRDAFPRIKCGVTAPGHDGHFCFESVKGYRRSMRRFLFSVAYWVLSVTYGLVAALSVLLPGRATTAWFIGRYVRRMVQAMGAFAGIGIAVEGRENLPQGAFIVASKHQSWGDGFATYNQFDDLAFVTGDHLEKLPLLGPILKKLGAIVVDSCGGGEARAALKEHAADAHREGRKILIFPEGALAPVGSKYRYRSGVFYMARDFGLPVVPLATNLGCFWPPEGIARAGTATLAFLPPIAAGEDKDTFLSQLEAAIEAKTAELVARAAGGAVVPARLIPRPDEASAAPAAAAP